MKGIILAGGSGSRLAPTTRLISKQLLAVYDKPMIYYPLATLMELGIREILIISTSRDLPNIEQLFGDGSQLGLKLHYREQPSPNGIAECFLIADDFIDAPVCLVLGDNIFILGEELSELRHFVHSNSNEAAILLKRVPDPERFGVAECDGNGKVVRLVEKPAKPTSDLVSVGLYLYPADVREKARALRPSARGELEITDLNNLYLSESRLRAVRMQNSSKWLDAGTPDSLLEAANLVAEAKKAHRNPIGYIELLALREKFIDRPQFDELLRSIKPGTPYRLTLETFAQFTQGR